MKTRELGCRGNERHPVEFDRAMGQYLIGVDRGDDQVDTLIVEHIHTRPLERHPLCLR